MTNHYKKYLLGAIAFLFISLSLISAPAQAQTPTSPQTFRVIVGFNASFRPEGELTTNGVIWQRFNIANRQAVLLDNLRRMNLSLNDIKRFRTIPFVALEVDMAGLLALRLDPSVTEIREDQLATISTSSANTVVNAPAAWNINATGSGYSVAILDTGVDFTHPALSSKRLAEACFSSTYSPQSAVTACPNGLDEQIGFGAAMPKLPPACAYGCDHGTHVAGIAAGAPVVGSPSGYSTGVAPDAMLIGVNVFSIFTSTNQCNNNPALTPCTKSYDSDQLRGLEYVLSLPAGYNVAAVNMSLGGGSYDGICDGFASSAYLNVISNLKSNRIAVVAATGNNGFVGSMGAPACLSNVVAVAATNDSDVVATFSNVSSKVALFAPGVNITSAVPVNWSAVDSNYGTWGGTSMATPFVAGAWAIMRQAYPNDSVDAILNRLQIYGTPVTDNIRTNGTTVGTGLTRSRLNIGNSLPVSAQISFASGNSNPSEGQVVNVNINLSVGSGTANLPSPFTINLNYGGTATRNSDYTAPNSVTFTRSGGWSPNTNYTAAATIPITILNDDIARGDTSETIVITFATPNPPITVNSPSQHTATITNTNVQVTGVINFASSTLTTAEFGSAGITNIMQVPVTMTIANNTSNITTPPNITASMILAAGTSQYGVDYTLPNNSVTFTASPYYQGTYTAYVPVNILARAGTQGNRTFSLIFQTPTTHPDVLIGSIATTTITIRETTNIVMTENELRDEIMTILQPTHQINSVLPDFIANTRIDMVIILDDGTVGIVPITLSSQNGTNRVVFGAMTVNGQPAPANFISIINTELPDLLINSMNNFITERTGASRRIELSQIGASEITFGYLP
ncbi:MAG: S8 family serine peptidase [Anaerolineae bacterium]|nr:S8 family serine peptidase [Anaerolineae bacterium]